MLPVAGFGGVGAVGKSLERLFALAFAEREPIEGVPTRTVLIRTDDLDLNQNSLIQLPALSLLLYRVDFNKVMRASWAARSNATGRDHLPLDLHYLLTAWAENAEHEHLILGRALQVLETTGQLSGPLLDPLGDWEPDEAVQLVLEDLTTDELMRTFEALSTDFRLTVPCLARVLVVEGLRAEPVADTLTATIGVR